MNRVTATELYEVKSIEIQKTITEIHRKLTQHAYATNNKESNWPAVGDLGRVQELLNQVNEFLKN